MKPSALARKGHCPTCGRPYRLRDDDTIPAHGARHPTRPGEPGFGYCNGSRKNPTEEPPR